MHALLCLYSVTGYCSSAMQPPVGSPAAIVQFCVARTVRTETSARYHTLAFLANFSDCSRSGTAIPRSARTPCILASSPCWRDCIRETGNEPAFAHDEAALFRLVKTLPSGLGWHALLAGCKWELETRRDIRAECGTTETSCRGLRQENWSYTRQPSDIASQVVFRTHGMSTCPSDMW